jgi:NADPH:quinone reductase-like Zn-dependent oxidoreductase
MADTQLQLRSLITADGELRLSLDRVPVGEPGLGEILVRIAATPINPSDLGLLVGPADLSRAEVTGSGESIAVRAPVPAAFLRLAAARLDQSLPVGNEGAGVVEKAGAGAEALVGKTVAILGGAMYAQYRIVKAADALALPEGVTPREGASCFVNPLTALGMVETMRMEGHSALVHTAAASNLGQMLQKICLKDGVALVNIVRSPEQERILREIGATFVCNSSAPDFMEKLVGALTETGATIGFDATGGGKLASQILTAMEAAANAKAAGPYNRYGSSTFKQVYIYGGLDTGPTELTRSFGFSWSLGGWLLTPFLIKIGPEGNARLRARVAAEIKTTFASHYTREISLADALKLDNIIAYNKKSTGEKFLINPTL